MPLKLTRRHDSPFWYIRGTVRGISVDESTRTGDKKRAQEIRAKREADLLDQSIYGRPAVASFASAALSYMEEGGESRFLTPILKQFATAKLGEITQEKIDAAAKAIYPKGSPGTLNRQIYAPVVAVLRHAAAKGWCPRPVIERRKEPLGRVRWLTPVEAGRLVDAASPHLQPLLTFLFLTGARLSEALYLDWRDVDLQRAHVAFVDTKNGDARGVTLAPRIVAALANLDGRDSEVFRRPDGEPYERKDDGGGQIKTAFKGACRRAGISDFTPHDCRHTWATWHYAANRDLLALMKLGGWKSEKMVMRYAHVNTDNLAPSIHRLEWGKSGDLEGGEAKNAACASS